MVSVVHGAPGTLRIYLGLQFGGVIFEFHRPEALSVPHVSLTPWKRNFEKSRFQRKIKDLGRFRALNRSGVFTGANFIVLRGSLRFSYISCGF